jgi:hypothetical protein
VTNIGWVEGLMRGRFGGQDGCISVTNFFVSKEFCAIIDMQHC